MKSICVFCGSSDSVHADYKTAAFQLGIVLAKRRIRLIYGGGKTGLMGEVANGALSAGGEVIRQPSIDAAWVCFRYRIRLVVVGFQS